MKQKKYDEAKNDQIEAKKCLMKQIKRFDEAKNIWWGKKEKKDLMRQKKI